MASTAGTLSEQDIRSRIGRLPRINFAHVPTPLEEAPKLSAALGGSRILVKREDLTGFALGGNKVRHMEFRMADVVAKGCDAFVLTNIGQSNHARLHSAACVRLGIHMAIVKPSPADEEVTGNLLLDRILGVEIVEAHGRPIEMALDETLDRLRGRGLRPYASTREPFSPIAGTVAFLEASIELRDQLRVAGIEDGAPVHIFLAHGSTAAGLALGSTLLGLGWRVNPVSTGSPAATVLAQELRLAGSAAELLELPVRLTEADFRVHDVYSGARYGDAPPSTLEAIRLLARTEAIFADPVYTGKALSGLIGEVRAGRIPSSETCVFVHTGGIPIIFAYHDLLKDL